MVWFIFREDYYIANSEPKRPGPDDSQEVHDAHEAWARKMDPVFGLAELIIAKQRHGSTGKVRLKFEAKITRFSDLAHEERSYGYD